MKSSENTVLEANRGCARPGSNKYWECNCFTTGHLLSIKSEQTLNKVIYGHLQTMKDNTNLCPMCKLPVKALGTRKRDTRTASPAEGRASSWRQNKLLKPWQPTVLWDWEERVSVSWRNVFWGNKSWSTFWISVKFWSAGENSRRHCGQRQDGEIEMKEPWGQVRRHRRPMWEFTQQDRERTLCGQIGGWEWQWNETGRIWLQLLNQETPCRCFSKSRTRREKRFMKDG